jgi:NADH:ubiquinone oxidoreductase subunit 6 (subunit J)
MKEEEQEEKRSTSSKFNMLLIILLFAAIMAVSVVQLPWTSELSEIPTKEVGNLLFETYWFALILIALTIAASILGGIYLAKIETTIGRRKEKK